MQRSQNALYQRDHHNGLQVALGGQTGVGLNYDEVMTMFFF